MNMAVLGTSGTILDNKKTSLVGYIDVVTCNYRWLYEIEYSDEVQYDAVRFGDTNGDTIIDGNLIVAVTRTYPRKFIVF